MTQLDGVGGGGGGVGVTLYGFHSGLMVLPPLTMARSPEDIMEEVRMMWGLDHVEVGRRQLGTEETRVSLRDIAFTVVVLNDDVGGAGRHLDGVENVVCALAQVDGGTSAAALSLGHGLGDRLEGVALRSVVAVRALGVINVVHDAAA